MKRSVSPAVVVLGAILVLAVSRVAPAQPGGRAAIPLGAARIAFSNEQIDNDFDVRAFVETGSLNPNCLATLAESNFAVPGISMFCSPRSFNGKTGVLVSIFFPSQPPADLVTEITLYQELAHGYAAPVLYSGQ